MYLEIELPDSADMQIVVVTLEKIYQCIGCFLGSDTNDILNKMHGHNVIGTH